MFDVCVEPGVCAERNRGEGLGRSDLIGPCRQVTGSGLPCGVLGWYRVYTGCV